jgi:hypothetical protein
MKCNFNEITSFSAKLHGSFKTAASVYAIIGASSYPRANIMTISAPTAPNPMVLVESRRSMFKSACWAVLGLAIVAMADFALAQLAHVGPTAAKEFAQRSALLAQAGDREGAVEASRNAVDTYRRLVHRNAAPYEPGLAASLHDLSRRLSEAGDAAGAPRPSRKRSSCGVAWRGTARVTLEDSRRAWSCAPALRWPRLRA